MQEDSAPDDSAEDAAGFDFALLWPTLRLVIAGLLVLALLLGPFLIAIGAKAARRRSRRSQGTPAARIAGGWDEYVDAAIDAGRDAPRVLTRPELAALLATSTGAGLAETADRAVFSGSAAADEDAAAYWALVDAERRTFIREHGFWRGVGATVSLRSFFRHVAPAAGARKRLAERGKRRVVQPARLTP